MRPTLAFALALAFVAVPAVAPGTAPAFSAPVVLPISDAFGEPSIAAAPDGTIYVTAPCPASPVWRSTNGGASFTRVASSLGSCGDSDISVSPDGTVYVSDLLSNVPVSVSKDKATSFAYSTQSIPGSNDRQWLATPADNVVFSGVNQGGTFIVAVSTDGALTWTRHTAFTGAGFPPPGQLIAPTANDVYIPYTSGSLIKLAVSHDAGSTWAQRVVASYVPYPGLGGTVLFPGVARGADGTLYAVWADNGASHVVDGTRVQIASSADDGLTWTTPLTLSAPQSAVQGTYNIFPWVVADAAGKVAVSWYQGIPPANVLLATDAAAGTAWHVQLAYSSNANAATPTWTSAAATGTTYTGPICTIGTGCVPARNPVAGSRALLDFFEMTELPNGNLAIAFPGNQQQLLAPAASATQLYAIHQTSGPNLK